MLRRGTALAAILVLSLALAACGGSGEDAPGDEAAATPTSTPAPTDTPAPADTPTATDTPEAQSTPTETASGDAAPGDSTDIAAHLSEKTMQMWEVYNTYDADALSAFYEPGYWQEEEDEVRANLRPFRTFGAKIDAEETSPPTEIAPGQWEVRHTGKFSLGSVKMIFIWEQFDGEWLLTYAEAQ
jgi:hypothetical protein